MALPKHRAQRWYNRAGQAGNRAVESLSSKMQKLKTEVVCVHGVASQGIWSSLCRSDWKPWWTHMQGACWEGREKGLTGGEGCVGYCIVDLYNVFGVSVCYVGCVVCATCMRGVWA